ncbi:MAG: hypothetical protein ACFFD2_23420 [Promethearchaeota archaeon]
MYELSIFVGLLFIGFFTFSLFVKYITPKERKELKSKRDGLIKEIERLIIKENFLEVIEVFDEFTSISKKLGDNATADEFQERAETLRRYLGQGDKFGSAVAQEKINIFIESLMKGPFGICQVKYPLDEFESMFAKAIDEFVKRYGEFENKFEQLLISRKIKEAETGINDLDSLFENTDKWLKSAEEWSKTSQIPIDSDYNDLLQLKKEEYDSIKDGVQLKIEKLRAELTSSIRFSQNFIQWNYSNLNARLQKFKTVISQEILRFISSEENEFSNINSYSNINSFLDKKFEEFRLPIQSDKEKVAAFYDTHQEFHIEEVYNKWNEIINEIPSKLQAIRSNLDEFIRPLHRLDLLIKGITKNFYRDSNKEINKYSKYEIPHREAEEKLTPLNILFSNIVWEINRIDNEIKDRINLLPFDLETPQLVILLRGWNETKEEILEKLNTLSQEQKVYKCEIMHEILDPLNIEIWECSNCGAVSCIEHLEKWYHRKKAPECFKCGKLNTFRLKYLNE